MPTFFELMPAPPLHADRARLAAKCIEMADLYADMGLTVQRNRLDATPYFAAAGRYLDRAADLDPNFATQITAALDEVGR